MFIKPAACGGGHGIHESGCGPSAGAYGQRTRLWAETRECATAVNVQMYAANG